MKYFLRTWLANWRKQQGRQGSARSVRQPLSLEYLEDRLAPAAIIVNTASDTYQRDDKISLREAILLADGKALPAAQQLLYTNLTEEEQRLVDKGNLGRGPTPDLSASNTIVFDLPGGAGGTITISKNLGALPNLLRPVTIRGGGNIIIDGGKTINVGLSLNSGSDNSGIYGLTVQNFVIDGIKVGSGSNRIGGSGQADRNTIQGNGTNIHITGSGNRLTGNTILNAVTGVAGQFGAGVFIDGGSNNWIGKESIRAVRSLSRPQPMLFRAMRTSAFRLRGGARIMYSGISSAYRLTARPRAAPTSSTV